MADNEPIYADLDLSFEPHPVTGDIMIKTGERAIDQALRSIIYTNFYDRPFHHDVGANLRAHMFEPLMPVTATALEMSIKRAIGNDEPRVQVIKLQVQDVPDQNGVRVRLKYRQLAIARTATVDVFLRRVR